MWKVLTLTFHHMWWACNKPKKDTNTILTWKILKMNIQMKPEDFLLGLIQLENSHKTLFLYMITAASLLYTENWKSTKIPIAEEGLLQLLQFAEMAKLTFLIRENPLSIFIV